MKYENFKEVIEMVNRISVAEEHLTLLDEDIEVVIMRPSSSRVYTIGIAGNSEHQYKEAAAELIEYIREDLRNKIDVLKAKLETL